MIELPDGKQLFRPDEVADIFVVKIRTVHSWIHNNKLSAIKVGGQWRIKREILIDFGTPSTDL